MDGKQDISSGIIVRGDGAPQSFCMAPRPENPSTHQKPGAPNIAAFAQPVYLPGSTLSSEGKKRRGRPRKYDGGPAPTLSPMPISASIPLNGDFSGWKQPKAKITKKVHKLEFQNLGDRVSYSVGANFTPHVMTVNEGEDINLKIVSFSRQESHAICVLSASGSISNVTLRQASCAGGTLTYQGRFEILSLTGSLTPVDNGIAKSRCGGISVVLAGPDGRVLGGVLAGILVAGSPVQVVLGSFLPGHHQEHNPKKHRNETVGPTIPVVVHPVQEGGYGAQRVNFASPASFRANNLPCKNSGQDLRGPEGDNNSASTPEGDSGDYDHDSPLNLEISG